MRGAVTVHGNAVPNYHFEDLMILAETYEKRKLINPACVVDANHANSNKKYNQQPRIVLEVLQSRNYSPIIKKLVKGVMVESFLIEGNQAEPCTYGQSITDPCIGWETTEKLILDCAAILYVWIQRATVFSVALNIWLIPIQSFSKVYISNCSYSYC